MIGNLAETFSRDASEIDQWPAELVERLIEVTNGLHQAEQVIAKHEADEAVRQARLSAAVKTRFR